MKVAKSIVNGNLLENWCPRQIGTLGLFVEQADETHTLIQWCCDEFGGGHPELWVRNEHFTTIDADECTKLEKINIGAYRPCCKSIITDA